MKCFFRCGVRYKNCWFFPLDKTFAFHCTRSELEQLLYKEFGLNISKESFVDIDFQKNIVYTDKAIYKVQDKIFDCSWPAMLLARKANLVKKVPRLGEVITAWGYWDVKKIHPAWKTLQQLTVLIRIDKTSWFWCIPLSNWKKMSVGLICRWKSYISEKEYNIIIKKHLIHYFDVVRCKREIKIYGSFITVKNFSNFSEKVSYKSAIFVWDAYCFSDPVFSTGTCVSMWASSYLASQINNGTFSEGEYEYRSKMIVKELLLAISYWYSWTYRIEGNKDFIAGDILNGKLIDTWYKQKNIYQFIYNMEWAFSNEEIFF